MFRPQEANHTDATSFRQLEKETAQLQDPQEHLLIAVVINWFAEAVNCTKVQLYPQ